MPNKDRASERADTEGKVKSWNELMQELVSRGHSALLETAKEAMAALSPTLQRLYPNEYGKVFYCIFSSVLAADGDLTTAEQAFIAELLGLPPRSIHMLMAGYTEASADFVDTLVDYLPERERQALILLVACVAACDESVSRTESAFLERLMS